MSDGSGQQVDVAVVGGGMVGLAAACLFVQQGLKVCLIDRNQITEWHTETANPRVSALNAASCGLLGQVGIWDTVRQQRATAYQRMQVWDSHSRAKISFDAAQIGASELGFIVEPVTPGPE